MFKPNARTALRPADEFVGNRGSSPPFTVGDFWVWAFSDLQSNSTRGVLAEFLVAKACGVDLGVRDSWANYDLLLPNGTRVEVKSAGLLQSWAQARLSTVVYSGLKARAWMGGALYEPEPSYRADVYVFALNTACTHDSFQPLDLDQWEFRVLPRATLEAIGLVSLSLARLKALTPRVYRFSVLHAAILEAGLPEIRHGATAEGTE